MKAHLTFLAGLILTASLLLGAFTWVAQGVSSPEDRARAKSYARTALQVLSLDAALAYDTVAEESWGNAMRFWSGDAPCVIARDHVQKPVSNHGPGCEIFHVISAQKKRELRSEFPLNCLPVLSLPVADMEGHTHLIAAAPAARMDGLQAGKLSLERLDIMARDPSRYAGLWQVPKFIKSGGMSHVAITLVSDVDCGGFHLFGYQVTVPDPVLAYQRLEAADYVVGIK
ncbi:hypothetical protein [Pacificoceanicola onchidii]|uniref:hypothetical protein n=1 Tax=Pacificoceanicola onchidii TaxID=2562685 RepID=UPI0010A4A8EC|nr:hypothetical protein [Pacificoceanicola onchidii]